jgi:hypothetical protein
MITLYQEVVTIGQKGIVGYSGDTSGRVIYIPVKTTIKKPVKFPDTIFIYEGWYTDYKTKKCYRWRGTEKEQVFYMDASLIDDSNNIHSPDEWMSVPGNKIVTEYYTTCRYCPAETKAAGNPSGHDDNIWLLSYQNSNGMEEYLYEFSFDTRDNIVMQVSLQPRIHLNLPPGEGNILSEVEDLTTLQVDDYDDPNAISDDDPNSGYQGDDSGTTTTDPPDDNGNTTDPSDDNGNTTEPDNGDNGGDDDTDGTGDPEDTEP